MTKPITDAARELRNYIVAIRDSGFEGGFVRRHWKDQANAALANIDTIDSEVAKAVPEKSFSELAVDDRFQSGSGIVCEDRGDEDLSTAMNYWGMMNFEDGTHMAHYILLCYSKRIEELIAARPPLPQSPDIAKVVAMADELEEALNENYIFQERCKIAFREGSSLTCFLDNAAVKTKSALTTYAAFKKENGL